MIRNLVTATLLGTFLVVACAGWLVFLAYSVPAIGGERICGKASWYGGAHNGRATYSGEIFRDTLLTAAMASPTHIGEVWRVTYDHKSVDVRVNDTGGFAKYGRVVDLSRAAFAKLIHPDAGVIWVCMTRVS